MSSTKSFIVFFTNAKKNVTTNMGIATTKAVAAAMLNFELKLVDDDEIKAAAIKGDDAVYSADGNDYFVHSACVFDDVKVLKAMAKEQAASDAESGSEDEDEPKAKGKKTAAKPAKKAPAKAASKSTKAAKKDDAEPTNYKKLKVGELRDLCEKKGLDTEGKKDDLVARLQANEQEADEATTQKGKAAATKGRPSKGKAAKVASDDEASDAEDASDEVDYAAMKVGDLRALCKEKGLEVKGKKDELIARLQEAGEDSDDAKVDYAAMTVTDLRALCEEKELDTKGVKKALVARLIEADGEADDDVDAESDDESD